MDAKLARLFVQRLRTTIDSLILAATTRASIRSIALKSSKSPDHSVSSDTKSSFTPPLSIVHPVCSLCIVWWDPIHLPLSMCRNSKSVELFMFERRYVEAGLDEREICIAC